MGVLLVEWNDKRRSKKPSKRLNDTKLGESIGEVIVESSRVLTSEAGIVRGIYDNGLRIRPEMANLYHELKRNGIRCLYNICFNARNNRGFCNR